VYSRGKISKVIATGDELPDTAGRTFWSATQLWFNNRGEILFNATLQTSDSTYMAFFTYSSGRFRKVGLLGDPTPLGPFRPNTNQFNKIFFNDDGVIIFSGSYSGVLHWSGTAFIKDLAAGDSAPGGRTFLSLGVVAATGKGDIAFNASFGPKDAVQ
jgi:hypothetical protein